MSETQRPIETSPCCSDPTTCCTSPTASAAIEPKAVPDRSAHAVRDAVREGYAAIAKAGTWKKPTAAPSACGAPSEAVGGCCGPTTLSADDVARAVGYASGDLETLPEGANLGLSCGNPTALAALRAGEVVLDLGAGGGFDCFLAGPRVGPSGRVIGVDMTPEMLGRARQNLAGYRERSGLDNVEFRLGEIEHLPVADASVDVVISNCVLNLSPAKDQVWRELARVLKPGGRVAISDLALLRPLPEEVRADVEALVGCVAGAVLVEDSRKMAEAAGLEAVEIKIRPEYVATFEQACDPLYQRIAERLPAGVRPADLVTSAEITARRPGL